MSMPTNVALVTGGSRGIGRAITLALAERGYRVTFCYRSDHVAARQVCEEAAAHGWQVSAQQTDVGNSSAVQQLVNTLFSNYGQIDLLVNNVGIFPQKPIIEISDDEWEQVLRTNLTAVFYCCRAVLPAMIQRASGAIINLSSVAGQRGSAYHAHYAAAKGGVITFTRSLAREVAQHNIRVNAIAPGRIATNLLLEHASASEQERWQRDTPARRLGTPQEVAAAVLFLADPANSYIIGETLAINGGLLMD